MDVVMLAQFGLNHAVATLGTATTEEHLRLLSRQSGKLVFMFDGDSAGRKAAARALETSLGFASEKFQVRFAFLPQGHDPDSLVRERGRQAIEEAARSATVLSEFLLQHAADNQDLRLAEGRAAAAAQARRLLALMPMSELKRQILMQASQRFQVDPSSFGAPAVKPGANASSASMMRQRPVQAGLSSKEATRKLSSQPALGLGDRLLQFLIRRPDWLDALRQHPDTPRMLSPLSDTQQALLKFIQDNRSAAGFAGLFEAAGRQVESPAMRLFNILSRPDPGLDDLFDAADTQHAEAEFGRLQSRLLLTALQRESDELTAVANADALQKLRQLHQKMVDIKQSLIQ